MSLPPVAFSVESSPDFPGPYRPRAGRRNCAFRANAYPRTAAYSASPTRQIAELASKWSKMGALPRIMPSGSDQKLIPGLVHNRDPGVPPRQHDLFSMRRETFFFFLPLPFFLSHLRIGINQRDNTV